MRIFFPLLPLENAFRAPPPPPPQKLSHNVRSSIVTLGIPHANARQYIIQTRASSRVNCAAGERACGPTCRMRSRSRRSLNKIPIAFASAQMTLECACWLEHTVEGPLSNLSALTGVRAKRTVVNARAREATTNKNQLAPPPVTPPPNT